MMERRQEVWLQVTAGQGPVECAWAVVHVIERIRQEAVSMALEFRTVEIQPGSDRGTAQSALVSIAADSISNDMPLGLFANSWRGTVQFSARSPFRPEHKRKNWFVGIDIIEPVAETHFSPKEVRWETMRASGPGGQHVNRTESAVRVTHVPTGIQAVAAEERSQHRNRKLALARLTKKLSEIESSRKDAARKEQWRSHRELERGNPVRTLREDE